MECKSEISEDSDGSYLRIEQDEEQKYRLCRNCAADAQDTRQSGSLLTAVYKNMTLASNYYNI